MSEVDKIAILIMAAWGGLVALKLFFYAENLKDMRALKEELEEHIRQLLEKR